MQAQAVQPQEALSSASVAAPAVPDGQPAGAAPSVKEAASAVAAMMQSLPAALDNKVSLMMYVWVTSVEAPFHDMEDLYRETGFAVAAMMQPLPAAMDNKVGFSGFST